MDSICPALQSGFCNILGRPRQNSSKCNSIHHLKRWGCTFTGVQLAKGILCESSIIQLNVLILCKDESFYLFYFWPCHVACRSSFPNKGLNLGPRQWKCKVLTTGLPENSKDSVILNDSYQQWLRARVASLTTKDYPPFYLEIFLLRRMPALESISHLFVILAFVKKQKKVDSPPPP